MTIKSILKKIEDLASYYKIHKPYIVGGLPRDLILNQEIKTNDIDITTNSPDVLRLGILTAEILNVPFELSEDGHLTVFSDTFDIDFSSNFISRKVLSVLPKEKYSVAEAFSRDFTINTLHQDLITGEFFDPTGMAIDDIKNKILRTPVDPEITFSDDPRRAYRVINLAVKYNLEIDPEIKSFILNNKELFTPAKVKDKYISTRVLKGLKDDPVKTVELLKELDLFNNVPLVGQFKEFLIDNKLLSDYLSISKQAKVIERTWSDYSQKGSEYKAIEDWWKLNYQKFPGHNNSFYSWASWYNKMLSSEWSGKHKGPEETLLIMKQRAGQQPNVLSNTNPIMPLISDPRSIEKKDKSGKDIYNVIEKKDQNVYDLSAEIVAVRNMMPGPNGFIRRDEPGKDTITLFIKDKNNSVIDSISANTARTLPTEGKAIIMPGRYYNSHSVGLHKGRPSFVQHGESPVKVMRPGSRIVDGRFGINIHSDLGRLEGCIGVPQDWLTAALNMIKKWSSGLKKHPKTGGEMVTLDLRSGFTDRVAVRKDNLQKLSADKNIETLYFFDFDGTLADSPEPEEGKRMYKDITGNDYPHRGWWGRKESLSTFDVSLYDNIVSEYKKARNDPNAKVILLTNRLSFLKPLVLKILDENNITFDHLSFKSGAEEKDERIKKILNMYPDVKNIIIYDDRDEQLILFKNLKDELSEENINVVAYDARILR